MVYGQLLQVDGQQLLDIPLHDGSLAFNHSDQLENRDAEGEHIAKPVSLSYVRRPTVTHHVSYTSFPGDPSSELASPASGPASKVI